MGCLLKGEGELLHDKINLIKHMSRWFDILVVNLSMSLRMLMYIIIPSLFIRIEPEQHPPPSDWDHLRVKCTKKGCF